MLTLRNVSVTVAQYNGIMELYAQPAVVQNWTDEVYSLAYYLLGSETLALAASEAAFAGLRHAADVSRPSVLRAALRQIERRRGLQPARGSRRSGQVSLERLLLALPLEQRAVLVLADVLALDESETAAVLGLRVGQVRPALARARRMLLDQQQQWNLLQPSQNGAPVSINP